MNQAHIHCDFPRIPEDILQEASSLQPAILADVLGRRGAMHGRIRPLSPHMTVVGTALTVDVRPGDNLMIHAAIQLARPGDVLVIDGKGDQTSALLGAIMSAACQARHIAGVVVDGAVRDRLDIQGSGFPVFCLGTNPNGPTKCWPGRIGYPVSVGGVTVHPGDLIVGDADGVVVIERARIPEALPAARIKLAEEAALIASIRAGNKASRWLEAALRHAGVLGESEAFLSE